MPRPPDRPTDRTSTDRTRTDRPSEPGTPVHVDYRKWDGSPHWQSDGVVAGVDEHGVWVAVPAGTHFERPGAAFDINCDSISLFPDAGWTPAFNDQAEAQRIAVYVDITTTPTWSYDESGWRVTMIDLDLDVIQRVDGFTFVDDEDEFAEHRRQFGYPDDVVARAEQDTRQVFRAVRDRSGAFDGTGWDWLRRFQAGRTATG
ncbi:YgaC family protein [Flexivirga sp. ID2601S]|uniref:YgaC family protein n=1 Tax=Flexivirga aerilata TaxID=1656889 RepID=A0A849AHM2_9MICO|nr:DUF402 domain-containing protein [Flexivirga aerilata]NNG40344.1 YgaC family protein [Flexivirga aerilata]